ncbi:MAG: carboxypeptidase-like regulatory domain-containing protein [Bacteroidales bacterium]|jgi:hypothetical protein|nr:carboxypeptidase-like regulatory domain-containing protein [Bacteroidales bacterium]
MKKALLLFFLTFLTANYLIAQKAIIQGKVVDYTGTPIQGVNVSVGEKNTLTGTDGKFSIEIEQYAQVRIIFSVDGYEYRAINSNVASPVFNLGMVEISYSGHNNFVSDGYTDAAAGSVVSEDEVKDQYVAGLLHSSTDAFVSVSGYTLSAGYFRPRGYDNEYSEVLISGLSMNDPETGRPSFSDWGGLNDATRFKESSYGLSPTRFSFGTLIGTQDIDVRASHQRKQIKLSYAFSNRTYQHRAMLTGSTGLMKNGWAVTASLSTRLGNHGYVEGTPYEAYSYFLSVEKKIGKKHFISFTGFGAPAKRGMQSAAVQEIYDMLEDNYYNPNWGWQEGKVRNARIRNSHEPVLMLSHYYDINDKIKLTTTFGFSFGRTGTTALNWYNAADPRPDYYRYLPSWQENVDPETAADPLLVQDIINAWKTDENVRQINWNELYQINYLSYLSGDQAKYILEERRLDHWQEALSSHLNYEINKHIFFSGGLNINLYKSRNYKVINDMLDGMTDVTTGEPYTGYWIDVDQYSERDFPSDTNMLQNDLNNPGEKKYKGDVFGYDYDVHINSANIWALSEFSFNHFDFFAGIKLSGTQLWRDGKMKNGRFPDDSYGKSAKHSFFDYAVKAGVTYKPTGRHYIALNGAYMTMAPSFNDIYISPRVRNTAISDIRPRKIFSTDLSYIIRYPVVKARLTGFYTQFWDDTKYNSFYHDDLQTFVNYMMVGINKTHMGIELGVEVKIIPELSVVAAGSYGEYRYSNQPSAFMSVENGSQPDSTQKIYCKNFFVNGTPQAAGSLGLKLAYPVNWIKNVNETWYANVNANIFANNWVDFNPSRRTSQALDGLMPDDPQIITITEQHLAYEKPQFTLDASLGKTFAFKKYYIGINASVSNILDNKKMITSGYEQLRFDYETKNIDKFPAKYYYGFGRTYFIMITFRY